MIQKWLSRTVLERSILVSLVIFVFLLGLSLLLKPTYVDAFNQIHQACLGSHVCFDREVSKLGLLQYLPFAHWTGGIGAGLSIVLLAIFAIKPQLKTTALKKPLIYVVICLCFSVTAIFAGSWMAREYNRRMGMEYSCNSLDASLEDCYLQHKQSLGVLNNAADIIVIGITMTAVAAVFTLSIGGMFGYVLKRRTS